MKARKTLAVTAAAIVAAMTLAACGGGDSGSGGGDGDCDVTMTFWHNSTTGDGKAYWEDTVAAFEDANPGVTINIQSIQNEDMDGKLQTALNSGDAPDIFMARGGGKLADVVEAGQAMDLSDALTQETRDALGEASLAAFSVDGSVYGVPTAVLPGGIYYSKDLFAQAGLPTDWQPESWDDILSAARTIKEKLPDVTPINVYAGKAAGEATTMQGFEMLLYGTDDELYDADTQKWITGSQGFTDSLAFLETIYGEGLAPSLDIALDASVGARVATELLPQGKLAMAVDGSWLPGGWITGDNAWPEWEDTLGMAAMPTQDGQDPGFTSMSGGWTLAVGAHAGDPQAAFDFIATALNKENSLKYDTENSQIAVRTDVAEDPEYLGFNPSFEFFSSLVDYTHFRPATPDYSQISSNIQVAAESVATGQATAEEAAATYDEGLVSIVGDDATQAAG